jgi:mRNA interferase HigB
VNVISKRGLIRLAESKKIDSETRNELNVWFRAAHGAAWRNLADVRDDFPSANKVGSALVFNIRHNRYRLITRVEFSKRLMFVKALLTHKEYDREEWKKWE